MPRSQCPISNALDHLGDRWSLLLIRDLMFDGKQSYGEMLESAEGIATNILSSRLSSLEQSGIISRQRHPEDGRKHIYRLTQAGIDLLPVLIEMILWSARHSEDALNIPPEFLARAEQDKAALIADLRARLLSTA